MKVLAIYSPKEVACKAIAFTLTWASFVFLNDLLILLRAQNRYIPVMIGIKLLSISAMRVKILNYVDIFWWVFTLMFVYALNEMP